MWLNNIKISSPLSTSRRGQSIDYFQDFEKNKLQLTIEIDSLKGYEKEWSNFQEAQDKEDKIDRDILGLIYYLS